MQRIAGDKPGDYFSLQSLDESAELGTSRQLACGVAVGEKSNFGIRPSMSCSIPSHTVSVHRKLAFERLLEYVQRVVQFRIL